jgi:hypothetical protein
MMEEPFFVEINSPTDLPRFLQKVQTKRRVDKKRLLPIDPEMRIGFRVFIFLEPRKESRS